MHTHTDVPTHGQRGWESGSKLLSAEVSSILIPPLPILLLKKGLEEGLPLISNSGLLYYLCHLQDLVMPCDPAGSMDEKPPRRGVL